MRCVLQRRLKSSSGRLKTAARTVLFCRIEDFLGFRRFQIGLTRGPHFGFVMGAEVDE